MERDQSRLITAANPFQVENEKREKPDRAISAVGAATTLVALKKNVQ